MRKLPLLIVFLLCCRVLSAQAQLTSSQAREAEWKKYPLPQTNFVRQTDPEKEFVFRVPADWKQEGTELVFIGPHTSRLVVHIGKIPDGYSLNEYFASVMRGVKDGIGSAEVTLTRKTQVQDLEAREIFFEVANAEGEMTRTAAWIVVNGPLGLTLSLHVPVAHATEVEPFFKAVVQSLMFMPLEHKVLPQRFPSLAKLASPAPIHEVDSIVASLNEAVADREAAVNRLAKIFPSAPDMAIDLLFDRRPLVRSAAVKALAQTNNSQFEPLLWWKLGNDEPLVVEAAARSLASAPDIVEKTLRHSSSGQKTELIVRIFPFMTKEKRIELLQRIFSETAVRSNPRPGNPIGDVTVTVDQMVPVKPGTPVPDVSIPVKVSNDPKVQIGALMLLTGMPVEEFKTPFARIVASNHDPLIASGLQTANWRGEALPVEPLFKLVGSSNERVNKLAAQSLGYSGTLADIPRIEALVAKFTANKKPLHDELTLSIKKIRFRHDLKAAKDQVEAQKIIAKATTDASLSSLAWFYHCEATVAGCTPGNTIKRDLVVKPLGENLFPAKLRHYTAIPNPGQAVQKLYETLNGVQLDSPRAQASLALILSSYRAKLGQQLNAPSEAETLIEYTGIDPNSPVVFGSWTADKASDTVASAQRRAIVLRVKDRERFEHLVERYQRLNGNLTNVTDHIAVGARGIAALPAMLPLIAQAMSSRDSGKTKREPPQTYSFVRETELNGIRVKSIEHRWVDSESQIESGATYMAFAGDTVILAPDLASLRDLLANASQSERQFLADNTEFRKAIERSGDIVYFSDLNAVMADISEETKNFDNKGNESGALKFGNSSWENAHRIVFDESDWAKPLLPFDPKELTAPRDLLPASTIGYFLTKADLSLFWSSKSAKPLVDEFKDDLPKFWAMDFKEVLAELGPECGAVLLELPSMEGEFNSGTWAFFCKLKSNKLADAMNAGKLIINVGPAKDFAQFKTGDTFNFVAVRNGFFVISNREKGIAAFDGKSSLATTRDYSRAVAKVPSGIVAFGGYNLEAAVTAASKTPLEGLEGQIATTIFAIAGAFHSQNFYATATAGSVEGRSSVSMDREGRYAVADFAKGNPITFATVEPTGVPITDQNRLSSLVLRVRAKSAGPVESVRDDIKTAYQSVEQKSPQELLLTVGARRATSDKAVELPVKDPQFAAELKATSEFPADDENVKARAREIAGNDRDAWSVARKLADWTHQNLEWKHVVSADPGQTLATREADCSEFSALFVAMARSLGLPARLVSGLAYSGNSFGGHAWVEVWTGKWTELDPTWGTHFVDATHIRNASSALVTSAALNLIELEVLEAKRSVEDFQKSPKAMAQHLIKAIPEGNKPDLEAAIDLAVLTDEFMGAGAWSKMNEAERDQMSSAYRRVLNEIIQGLGTDEDATMRLLHLEEKEKHAIATCLFSPEDSLMKVKLVRHNDLWYLVEILNSDINFSVVSEFVKPTITHIENLRTGQKKTVGPTDATRVLWLFNSDLEKAIALADKALQVKHRDQTLRFLKAQALLRLEMKPEQRAEMIDLLRELNDEKFAAATYQLADYLDDSEDEKELREAMALYERYVQFEPHDTRGVHNLAVVYDNADQTAKAEAMYRKAIDMSPGEVHGYLDLVRFLVLQDRIGEVRPVLVAGDKIKPDDLDLLASVFDMMKHDELSYVDKLAASEPQRMKTSAEANLALGQVHRTNESYATALRYFQSTLQLAPDDTRAILEISFVHRKQSRWNLALKFARQALAINDNDGDAYWELACALARLGKTKEAMTALEKAIELFPGQAQWLADEPDLKSISHLPAFKKLLPKEETAEKP